MTTRLQPPRHDRRIVYVLTGSGYYQAEAENPPRFTPAGLVRIFRPTSPIAERTSTVSPLYVYENELPAARAARSRLAQQHELLTQRLQQLADTVRRLENGEQTDESPVDSGNDPAEENSAVTDLRYMVEETARGKMEPRNRNERPG